MPNRLLDLLAPHADARATACPRPHPRPLPCEAPCPGWSESSWDLARGLTVLEGLPADASVAEWLGAALAD